MMNNLGKADPQYAWRLGGPGPPSEVDPVSTATAKATGHQTQKGRIAWGQCPSGEGHSPPSPNYW